jgi:hypothetical protein
MSKADVFLRDLGGAFDDAQAADGPGDERFAEVLESVPGLARPNNLALLNIAARCVEPGETYVEVGAFRGSSLIGAMLGNDDVEFVAIDELVRAADVYVALLQRLL